ncbi:cobaltochelatase subunit CobN [Acidovorax sp. Be4]|uniref:Cobaltochelatase subunit CobN n=1 Tax=Acidovorax bellezanensis TaxID=2976702 RepID=A0ABT2PRB4_9BURK|nr:cobaltochelatase subunit CobN [Acidovorax sp. Be4]MCT9813021.1 cobaltochelatase subunit CobN [Acidovorax sp. Be4]
MKFLCLIPWMLGWLLLTGASAQAGPAAPARHNVLIISASNVPLGKFTALAPLALDAGVSIQQRSLQSLPEQPEAGSFAGFDLVLIDAYQQEQVQAKLGAVLPQLPMPHVWLLEAGPAGRGFAAADVEQLTRYYVNGGQANYRHFFLTLQALLEKRRPEGIPAPQVFPKVGIYHPRAPLQVFASTAEYFAWRGIRLDAPDQRPPVVALSFHQTQIGGLQTAVIDDLVARIEGAGAVALPYYSPSMDEQAHLQILQPGGRRAADVLINTRIMLNADGTRRAFEQLGIPVVQATTYRRGSPEDWAKDPQGIPAMDLPLYVAQAEYTGINDIQIASAIDPLSGEQLPLDAQAQSVVTKALNWVRLQRKPAADKQLAIFFWNSPPGEKNLASAFLNVPTSLIQSLTTLRDAGYTTEVPTQEVLIEKLQRLLAPLYRDARLDDLLRDGLAATLPVARYEAWLNNLPPQVRADVTRRWGQPAASDMVIQHQGQPVFVIPRLQLGRAVLLPQPPRSDKQDNQERALYHSLSAVPTHFYLAAYLWARETMASDAIVHFGTHGSQEWLPGKERGLAVTDYPSLTVGDLPVVYPYIVDNIGEAQQAKRRGRAVTLSYQTPPFQPAGMHQAWSEVHDLLHAWQDQDQGAVKDQYRADILARVKAERMDQNMGWKDGHRPDNFAAFVEALHAHLHELAETVQPLGLHTLGQPPAQEHRLATVVMMLGRDYWHAAARAAGVAESEIDEAMVGDYRRFTQSAPFQLLAQFIAGTATAPDPALQAQLAQGREWYGRLDASGEMPALLNALAGKYIPTSYGGDPIKNPDAFPTGRNLYGFDPSRIPSAQAWAAGQKAAEQMIAAHRDNTGKALDKVTFSLWSVETMRHQGLLEAQALWLMGVEPVWDKGGRVIDVRRVDRKTLGRPRVDVVLSATGLYRDHFPNALRQLARAAQLAATAEEADNPAWRFSQQVQKRLIAQGVAPEAAATASQTRIFSTASGEYGTGLPEATLATDSWGSKAEGDSKLAALYLDRMQSAYGPDEKLWGTQGVAGLGTNLYAEHLKGTQAAVLSRSSNTYGMLTTDDPFQYLGGIGLAVRALDGKAPELYISNLRNPGATRTESAATFLSKELATRQFHPGYIQGLMKEGYSGTLRVLDATNNLWGWTATSHEIVRDDQWQEMADVYVNDKHRLGVREWMEKSNPHAYAQTMERMLEAARKGYWQTDDATLATLKNRYQQLQQRFGVQPASRALMDYVAGAADSNALPTQAPAAAPPAAAPAPAAPPEAAPEPAPATPTISGMQLQKVEPPAPASPASLQQWLLWALVLAVVAAGALRQARPRPLPAAAH